jgi:hypothetical protein
MKFTGDPVQYKDAYLWKYGFTLWGFRVRLREIVRKLKKHGFPMDELQLQLKGIVVGLPRDMVKLLHAEQRVRNRMTDKDLRLRRHGSWSDSSPDSSSSYPSQPFSFSSDMSDAGDEHLSSMCSSFSSLSDSSDEDKGAEMNEFIRGDDSGCGSSTWQVYLECIDRLTGNGTSKADSQRSRRLSLSSFTNMNSSKWKQAVYKIVGSTTGNE